MTNNEELVEQLCPKDCVYRSRFRDNIHYCDYIGMTGTSRGCPVSQCDKYRKGKKRLRSWTNNNDEFSVNYDIEYEE